MSIQMINVGLYQGTNPLTSYQGDGKPGVKIALWILQCDGGEPTAAFTFFWHVAGLAPIAGSIQPTAAAPNEIVRSLLDIINVYQRGI